MEIGIWTLVALVTYVGFFLLKEKKQNEKHQEALESESWSREIERQFDLAEYDQLLLKLKAFDSSERPRAAIKWWLGRVYFQRGEYTNAVVNLEWCCVLDPIYSDLAKQYLSFIEVNNLVAGVKGYYQEK